MKREPELVDLASAESRPANRLPATVAMMVVVFAWIIGWYWPTATDIASIWWRSDTFAHGLVVLPIFAWLVWRKRARIAQLAPDPAPWLIVPAAGFGLGWLLAELVHVAAAAHFSLVGMVVTALAAALGWRLSGALLFPLAFLFFGVPIGEFLLPTMIDYTADFTIGALRLSGVPVFREGTHFVIPNGRWSVVEACSGLRYLIASLMVGSLYAYLNYVSLSRRLKFMVVALVVPIVANWVRAYLTVMIGYLFGNEVAAGFIHIIYGWVFFGLVIFAMFWIGSHWHETHTPESLAPIAPAGATHAARHWAGLVPLAAVVAAFPLMLRSIDQPVDDFTVALALPPPAGGWQLADETFSFRPHLSGQRGEVFAAYRGPDGGELALHVAYFAEQQAGREMVMWGNGLVAPGSDYPRIVSRGRDTMPPGDVRQAVVGTREGRYAVWHWYWINGRVVTRDEVAKLLLAADLILRQADDTAHIAVMVPIEDDTEPARARAASFLAANWGPVAAMLEAAGEGRGR